MVNMDRLARLLRDGVTLVLDQVNVYDPAAEVASRALQWWSRETVQVNAYLTTGAEDGFHLHWDDHDVIVVQAFGSKRWEVRPSTRRYPMFRDAERSNDPPEEVIWQGEVHAGDVLHIPRGYWHAATREGLDADGASLHLTWGFVKRTGAHWATWAGDWTRENEVFRRDLMRSGGLDAAAQETELGEAFAAFIAAHPARGYLRRRERETPPSRHIPHLPTLLGPATMVVCVAAYPPEVIESNGGIEVHAARRKIRFPTGLAEVLRGW